MILGLTPLGKADAAMMISFTSQFFLYLGELPAIGRKIGIGPRPRSGGHAISCGAGPLHIGNRVQHQDHPRTVPMIPKARL